MANLLQKIILIFDRAFYVTIADTDTISLKSFHTVYDKYLDHPLVKFEQNCIWSEPYTILCFLTKYGYQFLTKC